MVKFFSQTYKYDDAWPTVTLAFFLRYPNPHASHVLACDVISRMVTEDGTLKTTRLIKKSGSYPSWFPKQFVSRPETWVVEESEVNPEGRVMSCRTRNLDHVKVMRVQEDVVFTEADDLRTVQKTTASIVSNFGWGLTKKIEMYGITKFKANLERSRKGVAAVLSALRESRQRLGSQMYAAAGMGPNLFSPEGQRWTPSTSTSASASMSTLDPISSTCSLGFDQRNDAVRPMAAPATSADVSSFATLRNTLGGGGLGLGVGAPRPSVVPQGSSSAGEGRPSSPSSISSID